jgi:hypothetical protein
VQDPRALDVQVEDRDVDELRSRAVGRVGDGARELELGRLAGDRDDLPGLDVRREADDEICEALERAGRGNRVRVQTVRRRSAGRATASRGTFVAA